MNNATFLTIAWRNLVKRPKRTAIVVMAISIGVFGLMMFQIMLEGFAIMMVDTVVDTSMGHIQLHQSDYRLEQDAKYIIESSDLVDETLRELKHVAGWSSRILVRGLASSAQKSTSVTIVGLDPEREASVTTLGERIVQGALPAPDDMRGVCIGRALARKLKVEQGDKIVIMMRDLHNEMSGTALRVCGLFKAHSESLEKATLYVGTKKARNLLGLEKGVHEVAIRLTDQEHIDYAKAVLVKALGGKPIAVESWKELAPTLRQQIEMVWVSTTLMFTIVFIALAFGIVNAFMMEIFERIHEFGVIMSLGTKPAYVFRMLIYEGFFVGAVGSTVGCLFALFVNEVVLANRLDLSAWSSGMSHFEFASVVPMHISPETVVLCLGTTMVVCVVATVYPALRAAMFRPVEALRHY